MFYLYLGIPGAAVPLNAAALSDHFLDPHGLVHLCPLVALCHLHVLLGRLGPEQ